MIPWLRGCPSPAVLSREFSLQSEGRGSVRILRHIDACSSCQREWAALTGLRALSRELPAIEAPVRQQEEIRTALLLRSSPADQPRTVRAAWLLVPIVATAAAVVLVPWARKTTRSTKPTTAAQHPTAPASIHRGRIHADDGAAFIVDRGQPDELVRLGNGGLMIEVDPLRPGERFRVQTDDAEIEVHGTIFRVVARGGQLARVDVWRGRVVVTVPGKAPVELETGGRWEPPSIEPPQAHLRRTRIADGSSALARQSRSGSSPIAEAAFGDGWRALRVQDFAEAEAAFQRAIDAAGDEPLAEDASFWKAACQARMRDESAARVSLAGFIDRFPRSPRVGEASAMLGWILLEQHDLEGAARRFAAAASDRVSTVRESARLGLEAVDRKRNERRDGP